jgi:hypothetical protein
MYYHGSNFTTCRLDGERKAEPARTGSSQPPHTPLCRSAASHARSRTGLLDPKPRPLPRWLKFAEPNQKTFHFKAPVTWQRIEQGAETKSKPCRFQSPREIQNPAIQAPASSAPPLSLPRLRPPRRLHFFPLLPRHCRLYGELELRVCGILVARVRTGGGGSNNWKGGCCGGSVTLGIDGCGWRGGLEKEGLPVAYPAFLLSTGLCLCPGLAFIAF